MASDKREPRTARNFERFIRSLECLIFISMSIPRPLNRANSDRFDVLFLLPLRCNTTRCKTYYTVAFGGSARPSLAAFVPKTETALNEQAGIPRAKRLMVKEPSPHFFLLAWHVSRTVKAIARAPLIFARVDSRMRYFAAGHVVRISVKCKRRNSIGTGKLLTKLNLIIINLISLLAKYRSPWQYRHRRCYYHTTFEKSLRGNKYFRSEQSGEARVHSPEMRLERSFVISNHWTLKIILSPRSERREPFSR